MSVINLSQLSVEDKKKLKSDNKKNITILVLIIIQVLLCCTLAKTCVACSTTEKKGGLTVMKGTGDHTWIETITMEQEDYQKLIKAESKNFNTSFDNLEPEFNSEI
jgi:hypothetical protein